MNTIESDILITYGASNQKIRKGDFVFHENADPHFYYQILEGEVKMISMSQDGKELIQGIFHPGQSFGEPPLFVSKPYPSSAIAMVDSVILKLSKEKLFTLMEDRPGISISILEAFAERIYKKAVIAKILSCSDPEEKIITFLDNYREEIEATEPTKIPYTRQQIADSTGLCVETVIRTIKKLSLEQKVTIDKHKVYY